MTPLLIGYIVVPEPDNPNPRNLMIMKIGTTRVVFLVGDRAIKVATIRPLRLFFRLATLPFSSKNNRNRFSEKYGNCLFRALWSYFLSGLYANRAEYEYHIDNPQDDRVMPTTEYHFGGLVISQLRGASVTEMELLKENPFAGYQKLCVEMNQPWQFCRHPDGRVVLVDYGRDETIAALKFSSGTAS